MISGYCSFHFGKAPTAFIACRFSDAFGGAVSSFIVHTIFVIGDSSVFASACASKFEFTSDLFKQTVS